MSTTVDLDDLEAKARSAAEASAADWHVDGLFDVSARDEASEPFVVASTSGQRGREAIAQHIAAANPAAVLELVQRLRESEAIVRGLAASDAWRERETGRCVFCGAPSDYVVHGVAGEGNEGFEAPHTESCLKRRAVEDSTP